MTRPAYTSNSPQGVKARLTHIKNVLLAQSRAAQFVYQDLPFSEMTFYDYYVLEVIDGINAAYEKVCRLLQEIDEADKNLTRFFEAHKKEDNSNE